MAGTRRWRTARPLVALPDLSVVFVRPDLTRPGSRPRRWFAARPRRPALDSREGSLLAVPAVRPGFAAVCLVLVARRGVGMRHGGKRERRVDRLRKRQYAPAARTTTTPARTNHDQPSRHSPAAAIAAAIKTPARTTRRAVVFSTGSPSTRGASSGCGSGTASADGWISFISPRAHDRWRQRCRRGLPALDPRAQSSPT